MSLFFLINLEGRLNERTIQLLNGADVQFRRSHRLDIALSTNMPVALVFLPAADIPRFVAEGRCALGITGFDQVQEAGLDCKLLLDLGFGKCKLQVQVPENSEWTEPKQLIGKSIVTSFTNLTNEYFTALEQGKVPAHQTPASSGSSIQASPSLKAADKKDDSTPVKALDTTIKYVGGSVEAAVALGVADAIVDLVESGETMRAAGLKPIGTVLSTSAWLIQSNSVSESELETCRIIQSRIEGVLAASRYVICNYNAPRSSLPILLKITPGRRAPTITSLEEEGWVAVGAMVHQSEIADVMDKLSANGAEDILVFNITNCRV